MTREGLLVLLAIGAAYRMFTKDYANSPDRGALAQFAVLSVLLAILSLNVVGAEPFK